MERLSCGGSRVAVWFGNSGFLVARQRSSRSSQLKAMEFAFALAAIAWAISDLYGVEQLVIRAPLRATLRPRIDDPYLIRCSGI